MKKTLVLLLAFLLLFSACKNTASDRGTALVSFTSQNGYEISYPDAFSPASLSTDIDFVIMDDNTGSSVTVLTEKKTFSVDITEKSFLKDKQADGMDIRITSFERKDINGMSAYEVAYQYNENTVTEILYVTQSHIYHATYTELPGTSDKLHQQMLSVITSLCV